ncbi:hypothetical protein PJP12_30125, partial [Mycobacterium kansasii]
MGISLLLLHQNHFVFHFLSFFFSSSSSIFFFSKILKQFGNISPNQAKLILGAKTVFISHMGVGLS